jgi:hypothetical protein
MPLTFILQMGKYDINDIDQVLSITAQCRDYLAQLPRAGTTETSDVATVYPVFNDYVGRHCAVILGMFLNRQLGRPLHALATLLT